MNRLKKRKDGATTWVYCPECGFGIAMGALPFVCCKHLLRENPERWVADCFDPAEDIKFCINCGADLMGEG